MVDGALDDLRLDEDLHLPESGHPTSVFYKSDPGVTNEDRLTQQTLGVVPSPVGSLLRDPSAAHATSS
ncbi:MAG: hypothetical protein OXC19_20155 [Bryobacterales bacterium]|nr:hypothetical protein [Bryobacterales bacterium]